MVYNLKHEDYISVVCGSLDQLHKAFANLDLEKGDEEKNYKNSDSLSDVPQTETASLPTADRRLIRRDEMQRLIASASKKRVPKTQKSSRG